MIREVAKFIKKSVQWLQQTDEGCCTYKLDDRLAICVGWLDGYGEEIQDCLIQSESEPDFAINAGIKVWTSDASMLTDYNWINAPYEENGDVWDTDITISPNENYEELAVWLLKEYHKMDNLILDEEGKIIGRSDEEVTVA